MRVALEDLRRDDLLEALVLALDRLDLEPARGQQLRELLRAAFNR